MQKIIHKHLFGFGCHICPQGRAGNEASQAMLIHGKNRSSSLSTCLDAAHNFLLSKKEAISIIENQVTSIETNWASVCEIAEFSETDRQLLWNRQFLNPYAFHDWV